MERRKTWKYKYRGRENVRARLPEAYKGAVLKFGTHTKLNQSYEALFIELPEKKAKASINLESLFDEHENGGDLEEFYATIPDIVESREVDTLRKIANDYDEIKPRLFIQLSRVEGNEELLKNIPYHQIEDLALTYYILVERNEEGTGKALLSNSWLESIGVSQEQLHQDALENSPKLFPPIVMTMQQAMRDIIMPENEETMSQENFEEALAQESIPLIFVSNEEKFNGAGVLFYPDVMKQLGEKLGDFCVIPSSVHETLILPDSEGIHPDLLKVMVAEVNDAVVANEDRLTTEVYHYDTKDRIFEKADKFLARQNEKSRKLSVEKENKGIQKSKKSHEMSL